MNDLPVALLAPKESPVTDRILNWLLNIRWIDALLERWQTAKRQAERERFLEMCRWFDEGRRGR